MGGHKAVYKKGREYARGDLTTNTFEGALSLLKRRLYGAFHSVSRKHLQRYLAEFDFRYNRRNIDDGERITLGIRSAIGKRPRHKEPVAKVAE